jgi:hypothetical protein
LRDFFHSVSNPADFHSLAIECCRDWNNPSFAFEVFSDSPFSEHLSLEIVRLALSSRDMELLAKCAARWPSDAVWRLYFEALSLAEFCAVFPGLPHGHDLTCECVRLVHEATDPHLVRTVLSNEMTDRRPELERFLLEMMNAWDFSGDFLRTVFAPPFEFRDGRLVQFVVNAGIRGQLPVECLLSFLERCSDCQERLTLLIAVFPKEKGDELVDIILARGNAFHRSYLIAKLVDFCVSEAKVGEILQGCRGEAEYLSCCLLADLKGFGGLLRQALLGYLHCDRHKSMSEQLMLYLNALSLIAGLSNGEECVDLLRELISNIREMIERTNQFLFPLLTSAQQKHSARLIKGVMKCESLQIVAPELQHMLEFMEGKEVGSQ